MKTLLTVCSLALVATSCTAPEKKQTRRDAQRTAPDYVYYRPTELPAARAPQPRSTQWAAPAPVAPREPSLGRRLRTEKIGNVIFDSETGRIDSVVRLIRTSTDIPVILTPAAREVIESQGLVVELELRAPITVANLLDFIASLSDDLAWRVKSGVVQIGSREETASANVLLTYDVRDLVFQRTSFLPPVIRGIPSGDEFGAEPRTGGEAEDKASYVEPDILMENVRLATDPAYWESDPDATIDITDSGYLVVKASPEIHRRIRRFLGIGR